MVTKYIPTREEALAVVDGDEELLDGNYKDMINVFRQLNIPKTERHQLFKDYISDNVTVREIGARFKINKSKIGKYNLLSIKTAYIEDNVKIMYMQYKDKKEIAKILNITPRRVLSAILELKLFELRNQLEIDQVKSKSWITFEYPHLKDVYIVGNLGEVINITKNILCKPILGSDKYFYISLYSSRSDNDRLALHRIMAFCYKSINNIKPNSIELVEYVLANKLTVNHKDGNKYNNIATNLEWSTQSENSKHAHETGLCYQLGESNPFAKLTDSDVHNICKLLVLGAKNDILQKKYPHVSRYVFSNIRTKKSWSQISDQYFIKPLKSGEIHNG